MSVNVRIRNGMAPSGDGGITEGDLRGDFSDIINSTSGVVDLAGGGLLVHEAAAPAMTVVVDAGVGYMPNGSFDATDSDTVKFWEAVVAGTTGSRTLSIGANSSGQTRYDIVRLTIDPGTSPDKNASNVAVLAITAGTPGAGVPATPAYSLKLAEVQVINGASSITNAKITDSRAQLLIKSAFLPLDTDGTLAANSDTVVASQKAVKTFVTSGTVTFTNKTIIDKTNVVEEITSTASSATPTPTGGSLRNYLKITALAAAAELQTPSGTPQDGNILIARIKDNGTARALTYVSIYRAIGVSLPPTTVLGKTLYLGMRYNSADSKWDVLAVQQEN